MDDLYDTTLYTDFNDLPEQTKKNLFDEWLRLFPQEKKLRYMYRYIPFGFAMLTALLVIISIIVAITSAFIVVAMGFEYVSIILLSCAAISLIICTILYMKSNRIMYDQSVRYATWLKTEKRIITELKPFKK